MAPHRSALLPLLATFVLAGCGGSLEFEPDRPPPADTVRVMAYNIHHAEGLDEELDLRRIGRVISVERPDLVALQEVDVRTRRSGGIDQARRLAELTGMEHAFGRFMGYDGGDYGMAILSRWPIQDVTNIRLPDGAEPRTALAVRVRSPETGQELVFVGIHFYRTDDERLAQADRLLTELAGETLPVILAGDFNSEPGSEVMDRFAGDWRILSKGRDSRTFPADRPEREIDYIAVRPDRRFWVVSHDVLDERVASDHRPLLAELVLRPR